MSLPCGSRFSCTLEAQSGLLLSLYSGVGVWGAGDEGSRKQILSRVFMGQHAHGRLSTCLGLSVEEAPRPRACTV